MEYDVSVDDLPSYVHQEVVSALEASSQQLRSNVHLTIEATRLSNLAEQREWFDTHDQMKKTIQIFREDLCGVGAYNTGSTILLYIDPNINGHKNFLQNVTAHEYSHVVRSQVNRPRNNDLANRLVDEGLAQCFEEDITGNPSPYSNLASEDATRRLYNEIQDRLTSTNKQLHNKVLYGDPTSDIFDQWIGYTLGYRLVKNVAAYDSLNWEQMIRLNAEYFIERN